jgi:plastocyanin
LRKKIAVACTALAVPAFAAALTQAGGAAPEPRIVNVRDNFFAPDALTVPTGHEDRLALALPARRRPRRVSHPPAGRRKRFHSRLTASDFSFARKLKKPGRYRIVCTIHAAMTMSVKVRR